MNTKACIISSSSQMPEVTDEEPGSLVPHLNTAFNLNKGLISITLWVCQVQNTTLENNRIPLMSTFLITGG